MATESVLAVIMHADVVGSTTLVQKDERVAHERIRDALQRLAGAVSAFGGTAHEVRGDALVAEFARASDATSPGRHSNSETHERARRRARRRR